MSDKIEITDQREVGFFQIDNEILDNYDLTPLELAIYCHLVRWSAARKRTGYITTTEMARKYQKRRASISDSFKRLSGLGLIKHTATEITGVKRYSIMAVKKGAPVPRRNTPRSEAEHPPFHGGTPPVPTRNTRKKEQRNTKERTKKAPAAPSLSMRTVTDRLVELNPALKSLGKASGRYWQLQNAHAKNLGLAPADLLEMVEAYQAAHLDGQWWASDPVELTKICTAHLGRIQGYIGKARETKEAAEKWKLRPATADDFIQVRSNL